MSSRLSTSRIWAAPLTLGLASVIGLISALLADGWWDILSWLLLAVPVVICLPPLMRR